MINRCARMKKNLLLMLIAMTLCGCGKQAAPLTLLVGTYTDSGSRGIYTFRFDPATGESTPLSATDVAHPSFLAVTPDNRMVYAVSELADSAVVSAFDFHAKDGTLTFRNSKPTEGRHPCHVTFTGKDVAVTNYSSGSLTLFPLDADGALQEGTVIPFFESGPDPRRQAGSHIHSSQVSPDGKYLFVMDLGGDYIYRFPVCDGQVSRCDPVRIKVPDGQGPRHFTFSKDGRFLYLLTELGGDVLVYDYNDGDLRLIQTIEADSLHVRGSADIHFSPDGKFLYASNRLKGDGIAIFSQDPETGLLTHAGYRETAVHPRNFAITPDGKYVLVACRDSDLIQVFRRDAETGLLTETGKDITLPHPVCVILAGE